MADLMATISAVWKGAQATKTAERDIDGLSGSVKSSALEMQIAADKTSKLSAKTKELARSVAAGDKSIDSAEKELKEYSKQLGIAEHETKQLDGANKNSGMSFGGLASKAAVAGGVLAATGLAAKAAYDYIGEGAELSAAAGKFDNLSVSINTTGDTLLGKMRDATKGMISDADLVASGTDIMSLGLAKTETGVVRMASAVGALNLDMQVLALTLANDSTARLDNLGLSLEAVTAKKKELIASGFIGDAFDEAVLIELEKKMQLLGDASQTTAGKMQIMETNVSNLKDGLSLMVAESTIVAKGIDNLSGVIAGFNTVQEAKAQARDDLTEAVLRGIVTDEEADTILRQAIRGQEEYVHQLADVRDELEKQQIASAGLSNTAAEVEEIMLQRRQTTLDNAEAERMLTIERVAAIETSDNYADSLYENEDAARGASEALMAAAFAETALMEAQLEAVGVTNSQISILDSYNESLGGSSQALQTAAGRQDEYRQNISEMNENVSIAADRVDNLTMKLLGIPPNVSTTIDVDTSAAEAKIGSLEAKLFGLGGAASAGANVSGGGSPSDPFAADTGGLATGTGVSGLARGGSYMVGEAGAEMVTLPAGSSVTNAQDYSSMVNNFNGVNPSVIMRQQQIQRRRAR